MNPVEIEEAVSTLASAPFDRAEFPYQFLTAFGNKTTTIQRLRAGSTNASDIDGGVLQRGNIHIATCAPGDVDTTLKALRESPKTAAAKAKFILATDGDVFQAEDLTAGDTVACAFQKFDDHFGLFLPLAGITTVAQIRESSFDIKATGRLNRLYVELLKENADWAAAERRTDMNHFMARLIFCFFAEDTDIFVGEGLFTKTVEQMSARDSTDTHRVIGEIFRAMDTKLADRDAAKIPRYANQFPYVNGQLFSGSTDVPTFSKIARSYLNHIGSLNWKKINPDIFGSMIQAVADDDERGALGMHYTSVPNILKVLNPLFLGDLRSKLEEAADNARKLLNLRNRMAKIRVFDPACGSGNFLVIAYKEMRAIEADINRRRGEPDRRTDIPLTNFRGIELRDFPAEIARLALIIAEYQCDILYRGQKEALAEFLPLNSENWITCGNALRLDWLSVCPPTEKGVKVQGTDLFNTPPDQAEIDFVNEGGDTYICGNPPYLGSKRQSLSNKSDLQGIFDGRADGWKVLDYVAGWFAKATEYAAHTPTSTAFVATNSVCQGQQVAALWPFIFKRDQKIAFAYNPFKWANLAHNNAGVTVVIVGISNISRPDAILFDVLEDSNVSARRVISINPYLIPGIEVIVESRNNQLSGLPEVDRGNSPTDGGNLILAKYEVDKLDLTPAQFEKFVKVFVGSNEIIHGERRYCIWINDDDIEIARQIPQIAKRVDAVRDFRLASSKAATVAGANWAHRFDERKPLPTSPIIVIPITSSETRPYLPVDLMPSGTVVSNLAFTMALDDQWSFAIISSRLLQVWVATVCSRLEMRLRFTNTVGWNTFPVPKLTEQNKSDLSRCAEEILLAREAHFPATIADLYDTDTMPADLRAAHERNDEVLERIYVGRRFRNDTERLEKLFELYTHMTTKKVAA